MTLTLTLLTWLVASVALGFLTGACIRFGMEDAQ
jgi:hypothetical protein